MPWGTKQPTNRGFGLAAVCANATPAGTIASRSGSASAAPAPRRTVRRDMCFFVINVIAVFSSTGRHLLVAVVYFHVHLERRALHDTQHYGSELVLAGGRIAHDRPHQWHVLILNAAAQGVSEQVLG